MEKISKQKFCLIDWHPDHTFRAQSFNHSFLVTCGMTHSPCVKDEVQRMINKDYQFYALFGSDCDKRHEVIYIQGKHVHFLLLAGFEGYICHCWKHSKKNKFILRKRVKLLILERFVCVCMPPTCTKRSKLCGAGKAKQAGFVTSISQGDNREQSSRRCPASDHQTYLAQMDWEQGKRIVARLDP